MAKQTIMHGYMKVYADGDPVDENPKVYWKKRDAHKGLLTNEHVVSVEVIGVPTKSVPLTRSSRRR